MGYLRDGNSIIHQNDDGTRTKIGEARDSEKAHFLVTAANQYRTATLDQLTQAITQWGIDRDFPNGATASGQVNKLFEEGGELSGAVTRNKTDLIKDGIGDCFVVLCMIALCKGIDVTECIAAAYDEIKDRKGTMIDGKFVKEEA